MFISYHHTNDCTTYIHTPTHYLHSHHHHHLPQLGLFPQFFKKYYSSVLGLDGFNIGPMLTRPKSRGSVRLRSGDPHHPPLIDPNYLSHPDDVTTFIRGQ